MKKIGFGKKLVVFDGGMGTMLQQMGMTPGLSPEAFMLDHPEIVTEIHRRYVASGCDVITSNTFGASRSKLSEYHLQDRIEQINSTAIECARKAASDSTWIAGSIGPSGQLLQPMGTATMEELQHMFTEQARILKDSGVDFVIIETMGDLGELIAAVRACVSLGVPFIPSMTFDTHLRTLSGSSPEAFAVTMEPYQPLAIGTNCGMGPDYMFEVVRRLCSVTSIPVLAQPNAGLPEFVNGKTQFSLGPIGFADLMHQVVAAGASALGGCCGTTPDHISAMTSAIAGAEIKSQVPIHGVRFASRSDTVIIGDGFPFAIIGERLNPTGRKKLSSLLSNGDFSMVREDARRQVDAGAVILDVNMGVPDQPEDQLMHRAIEELQTVVPNTPLAIDSMSFSAIEAGLKAVIGRPLVNSINGEEERLDRLLPLVKTYGANFIALAMDSKGIPEDATARIRIAEKILRRAEELGIDRSRVLVDCLVFTVGSQPHQPLETLKAITKVQSELGCATILGVSNVSFGLPGRDAISSVYLAMALQAGLHAGIINPLSTHMMQSVRAGELLLNRDQGARKYVAFQEIAAQKEVISSAKSRSADPVRVNKTDVTGLNWLSAQAIIEGNRDQIRDVIGSELASGQRPDQILKESLIPAIAYVGERYGAGVMYLPQLILAGETMKIAVNHLRPMLKDVEGNLLHGTKIVIGTVAGDIHDIGKNIVAVVLENQGFDVIDLGKDVSSERFLRAIEEHQVPFAGLSALMTTTMPSMRKTVQLLKSRCPDIKILVGGAVVTQRFADEIGADGYASEAVGAGALARRMLDAKNK